MKLIHSPQVYVVGRQTIEESELDRFLCDEDVETWETDTDVAGERLVEIAGRLCYMSYAKPRPGGHAAYASHILESGHGSVLEHAVLNLIITGVSRSLSHELVRHRVGLSPSQLSQRYVDESNVSFVVPPALEIEVRRARTSINNLNELMPLNHGRSWTAGRALEAIEAGDLDAPDVATMAGLRWLNAMGQARDSYSCLAGYLAARDCDTGESATDRRKRAREAARSVLPNATETKLFLTLNGRALRHLLELRGSPAADAEFRRLAVAILEAVKPEFPDLLGDLGVVGGNVVCIHKKV